MQDLQQLQIDFKEGTKSITIEQAIKIHKDLHIALRVNDGKRVTFQVEGPRQ